MTKQLLLVLFIFSASFLYGQIITICDENNLQPIENVVIYNNSNSEVVLTNLKGQANISQFKLCDKLFFKHPTYELTKVSYSEAISKKKLLLKESNVTISEVIISANKWAQKQIEVPSRITSISPKQVDFFAPQTTADLLGTSGEVFIQKSQQGGGSPIIRGFATNRLLIAVDGVRMNTAIFRSGNLQNVISLDAFAIENTEILYGPSSVIYGSDAIGGVMSFTTLNPVFADSSKVEVKGKVNTRFTSANSEGTGHVDCNVGFQNWAMLTSFTYTQYGDLKMGSKGSDDYLRPFFVTTENGMDIMHENHTPEIQVNSGFKQMNLMQKFSIKLNKNLFLHYGFHYSETSDYDRYDRLIRTKNNLPKCAEWYYGPQIWMMNNLNLVFRSSNRMYDELTVRTAFQFFEESRHDRNFNEILKSHNTEKVDALSLNIDFHKEISKQQQLFYGIEGVYNKITSTGEIEDISTNNRTKALARYPDSDWQSFAAFISYNFEISDQIRLNAGMRYNAFIINAIFDTAYHFPFNKTTLNNAALTGDLGAVYTPIKNLYFKMNVSTGFRSPNIDDMGKIFDSGEGIVVVPNPNLNAEYANNFEFGITHIINDVFKYDITAFYTLLNNALIRRDFQFLGQDSIMYKGEMSKVKSIQNGAKVKVKGIQAGINIKFAKGFGFESRYSYQKGIEEAENGNIGPSRHAVPMFGATHLTYSKPKIKLDIYAVYTGEVSYDNLSIEELDKPYLYANDENGNPYSPAWYTLNLKTMYQLNNRFSLTLGVENITNIRYRPYSSGIAAAGRNYIIAAKASF